MSIAISNFTYNSNPIEIKSVIPVGTIVIFGGSSSNIPTNWHICDGTTFSTTGYPDLYNVIGSRYNNGGESSGIYRIPDLVDKYVVSTTATVDASNFSTGANTMEVNQIPSHTHTFASTNLGDASVSVTGRIGTTNVAGADDMGFGGSWISHWSTTRGTLSIPVTGGSHQHTIYHSASTVGSTTSESISLGITHKKLYYIIKISV